LLNLLILNVLNVPVRKGLPVVLQVDSQRIGQKEDSRKTERERERERERRNGKKKEGEIAERRKFIQKYKCSKKQNDFT